MVRWTRAKFFVVGAVERTGAGGGRNRDDADSSYDDDGARVEQRLRNKGDFEEAVPMG
jgi:hypothetical protein